MNQFKISKFRKNKQLPNRNEKRYPIIMIAQKKVKINFPIKMNINSNYLPKKKKKLNSN